MTGLQDPYRKSQVVTDHCPEYCFISAQSCVTDPFLKIYCSMNSAYLTNEHRKRYLYSQCCRTVLHASLLFACALKVVLQYKVQPKLLGAAGLCTPSFAQHDMASS